LGVGGKVVEHTFQIAIQAALDVASHIVADERLGEPETNRELLDRLSAAGWLTPALAETMKRTLGFPPVVLALSNGPSAVRRSVGRGQSTAPELDGTVSAHRTTFPSASSSCAVTETFSAGGTRGVHPRCNCAARRPDSTANSKAFIPSGRLTIVILSNLVQRMNDTQGDATHAAPQASKSGSR
jgi:Protein of unknown function DUF86